jgi:hypothetical protein
MIKDGFLFLALAIIEMAIKDVRRGDEDAAQWLLSTGFAWLEFMGESPGLSWWAWWVGAGCPDKNFEQGLVEND